MPKCRWPLGSRARSRRSRPAIHMRSMRFHAICDPVDCAIAPLISLPPSPSQPTVYGVICCYSTGHAGCPCHTAHSHYIVACMCRKEAAKTSITYQYTLCEQTIDFRSYVVQRTTYTPFTNRRAFKVEAICNISRAQVSSLVLRSPCRWAPMLVSAASNQQASNTINIRGTRFLIKDKGKIGVARACAFLQAPRLRAFTSYNLNPCELLSPAAL
eukprot:scaffold5483_cov127-Isochrysis_galbana.AAC.3